MSAKHLQRTPHNVTTTQWWYEERAGITVVVACVQNQVLCGTTQTFISWRALKAALKRKET